MRSTCLWETRRIGRDSRRCHDFLGHAQGRQRGFLFGVAAHWDSSSSQSVKHMYTVLRLSAMRAGIGVVLQVGCTGYGSLYST